MERHCLTVSCWCCVIAVVGGSGDASVYSGAAAVVVNAVVDR